MLNIHGSLISNVPNYPAGPDRDLTTVTILLSTLSRVLTDALAREGVAVHTNKHLVSIEQPSDGSLGVMATFMDGTSAYGDIVVGADGVHSTVRTALFPDRVPHEAGFVGYAGVVDDNPFFDWTPSELQTCADTTTGRSLQVLRVSKDQLFWVMYEPKHHQTDLGNWKPRFDANLSQEKQRLMELAKRWELQSVVPWMIRYAKEIATFTPHFIEPLPQWSKYNCVLLGAAKHAMPSFLGHACALALEDVDVLAELLARLPNDPRRAFQMYQDLRYPRVKMIWDIVREETRKMSGATQMEVKVGDFALRWSAAFSSMKRGNLTPKEILLYDGRGAVLELLSRNGSSQRRN
ncbi:hypothetical protein DFJ73DRAFT_864336 [Zopfochytrium polystomum]|nr:hypothetical protein DFJ73DRAFT_864336 [Zopfochytrium polystomum]